MSVLLVTDDVDDDIRTRSLPNQQEYFYKQLKELEYDLSLSSKTSFSFLESSSSAIVKSNKYYRQHRRRHHARPQQCMVQHLLTYMLTLLLLTNHLHWSVIFLSISSIKIMSTHASTTIMPSSASQTALKRPISVPSTSKILSRPDEPQCLPIDDSLISRLCSRTCRTRKLPTEIFENMDRPFFQSNYLPFCSNLIDQKIVSEDFFNTTTESQCRENLTQLLKFDEDARMATELFAVYMQAIDSASDENRYSIIPADCQKAYRIWACSVKIPYFHRNRRIPPCQTICDEVERVCPTFRPSDREPLFAGQPLFFCDGGIVRNSDYGYRPHCFDSCHVQNGSLQRPSVPTSPSLSRNSSISSSPVIQLLEHHVTTPPCFEIQPPPPSSTDSSTSSLIFVTESMSPNRSNTSLSASARTIISPSWSSVVLTLFVAFLQKLS
ncbi:unnamed protein product [Adineta ricciae]|uniref:FZ domain-containing protein n=1 Tax=Adineta ricciae TaxID=249248 RepID=A0A815UDL8_ADIRI|nr:unnamed protein product [Adineta ricciae]